jgi:hypothetical protein
VNSTASSTCDAASGCGAATRAERRGLDGVGNNSGGGDDNYEKVLQTVTEERGEDVAGTGKNNCR